MQSLINETLELFKEFNSINEASIKIGKDIYSVDDKYAEKILNWLGRKDAPGSLKIKKWPSNLDDVEDATLRSKMQTLSNAIENFPEEMQQVAKPIMLDHIDEIINLRSDTFENEGKFKEEWEKELMNIHTADRSDSVGKGELFLATRFNKVIKPGKGNQAHYDLEINGEKISVKYADSGSFKLNDLREAIKDKITEELIAQELKTKFDKKTTNKISKFLKKYLLKLTSHKNVGAKSFASLGKELREFLQKNSISNQGDYTVRIVADEIPTILSKALNLCIDIDKFIVFKESGWYPIEKHGSSFNLYIHNLTQDKIGAGAEPAAISTEGAIYGAIYNSPDMPNKNAMISDIMKDNFKFNDVEQIRSFLAHSNLDAKDLKKSIEDYNLSIEPTDTLIELPKKLTKANLIQNVINARNKQKEHQSTSTVSESNRLMKELFFF